jgi:hypothetical protein
LDTEGFDHFKTLEGTSNKCELQHIHVFLYAAMTPKAIIDAAVDRITENKFFFVLVVVD